LERASPDAAVVMNHHYERDLESLAACLDSAVPFIGVLGPRHRTGLMLDRLHARGVALQGAEQRIHAPVGLDLGGETAEEIALSIVAEIKASVAGRTGGALRNREAPIHHGEQRRLEAV
jgi:xanthine/CO dehydrogenase XdhC/CoxF family maturation factor